MGRRRERKGEDYATRRSKTDQNLNVLREEVEGRQIDERKDTSQDGSLPLPPDEKKENACKEKKEVLRTKVTCQLKGPPKPPQKPDYCTDTGDGHG